MDKTNYALGLSVIAVLIAVTVLFTVSDGLPGKDGRDGVGGQAGPKKTEHQVFLAGFTKGGPVVATTSTASAYTLEANEWSRETNYVSWLNDVNGVDIAITTMASTSAPLVGLLPGQSFELLFYNASSTGTITFVEGTGVDLQEDEGETVIVNGLEVARITFLKKADSDVIFWVEVGQEG